MNPLIFALYLVAAYLALIIEWPWMRAEMCVCNECVQVIFNITIVADGEYAGTAIIAITNPDIMADLLINSDEICVAVWRSRVEMLDELGVDLRDKKNVGLYHASDTMTSAYPLTTCQFAN